MTDSRHDLLISEIKPEDNHLVASFISDNWGSATILSRGKIQDTTRLPGFICKNNKKVIGLVTYNISGVDCEIVTLDSKINDIGLGTRLVEKVVETAKSNGCKRVWLITTNDNVKAIRFYQKRGFEWIGFYKNSILESRKIKPEIPKFGYEDIPIKHEIKFELRLG